MLYIILKYCWHVKIAFSRENNYIPSLWRIFFLLIDAFYLRLACATDIIDTLSYTEIAMIIIVEFE